MIEIGPVVSFTETIDDPRLRVGTLPGEKGSNKKTPMRRNRDPIRKLKRNVEILSKCQ